MDEDKVETVRNWSQEKWTKNGRLNNLFEVQQFLGFSNYYRRFISKYSEKVEPLTRLTKRDEPCVWEAEQQMAFETMVMAITTPPVLRHFDHEREVIIETDASNYLSAGVLSQYEDERVLHPVAYDSKKHTPAKCNYHIFDTEPMAIIKAHEEWRQRSKGATYPLQLLTNHKNLEDFMTKKRINKRQAQWSQFWTTFEYHIVYTPGKLNGIGDALIRRPGDLPEGGDERLKKFGADGSKAAKPTGTIGYVGGQPARPRPSVYFWSLEGGIWNWGATMTNTGSNSNEEWVPGDSHYKMYRARRTDKV